MPGDIKDLWDILEENPGNSLALGIDVGTTTVSAAVADTESCRQAGACTLLNDSAVPSAEEDIKEQDADIIAGKVDELLTSALKAFPGIKAIGFTGQMHGVLYTDKNGFAASPLYTWQDGRASRKHPSGKTYCEEIKELTGYDISPGFGLASHYYNKENGMVPESAVSMCTAADYAAMRTAKRKTPLMHSTNAASLGLYDIKKGAFDIRCAELLGIDARELPETARDGQCLGYCGDIPVFTAIGDNQASFFGTVREDRDMLLNYGTGSQISMAVNSACAVEGMEIRPYVNGKYLLNGSALCGGKAYAMTESFFSEYLKACGYRAEKQYEIMNGLALKVYKTGERLKVTTAFCGTRADPDKKGSVLGLNENNFKPEYFILGVLQGMVDELYEMYRKSGGYPYENVVASGNAVQKNPVLQMLIADSFQTEIKLPAVKEEAAYGAALCAAVWAGLGSEENIKKCISYHSD